MKDDNLHLEIKPYLYSVLTVNTNTYEPVREVNNPNPLVEYVCVTDNPELKSETWKIIYVEDVYFLDVKHHQYDYVSTDVCLWLDGSYQIDNDPTEAFVLPFIKSNKEFAISLHDVRHNCIEECVYWMYTRPDRMPFKNGDAFLVNVINGGGIRLDTLFQTSCMLTKKTSNVYNIFKKLTEFESKLGIEGRYSDDQTTLSYIANVYYPNWDGWLLMNFATTSCNAFFHWCSHGSNNALISKQNSFICFGKEQELFSIGNRISD